MPAYKEADMVVFASPIDFAEIKLYLQFNDKLVLRRYSRRKKRGPQVRKGKAMLQIHTNSFVNIYSPYDLRGIHMPSELKSESIDKTCLSRAGSSGRLGSGASVCIVE